MSSRAYTKDEVLKQFLDEVRGYIQFWSSVKDRSIEDRLSGLAFSILALIDGEGSLPPFDLVARPHPDDKQFMQNEGENWCEDGDVINENVCMHDMFYLDKQNHSEV